MRHTFTAAIVLCAMLVAQGCGKGQGTSADPRSGPRVVSLAPNITEIVCAIGGASMLVGRSSACDYPPEVVKSIRVIGEFGKPSLELLVSVKPTIVFDADLEDESVNSRMNELGIRHERVPCRTLDDIPSAVLLVGARLGLDKNARELAESLLQAIADLKQNASSTNQPAVFVEIWSDPVITAGKTSFVSDLVRLAGGRNIGDEVDKDYFEVSSEWVVSRNPDIIIYLGMSDKTPGRNLVMKRAGWQGIAAVRSGRVYDKLSNIIITRPGPRLLEGIGQIRACITGEWRTE